MEEVELYLEDITVKCELSIYHQPFERQTLEYPGCPESYYVEEIKILSYDRKEVIDFYNEDEPEDDEPVKYDSCGVEWIIHSDGKLEIEDWDSDEILDLLDQ